MAWLRPSLIALCQLAALAVAYYLAARLGLTISFVHGTISPVWPPTGLALAFLALWGMRLWPAVAVGAFAANLLDAGLGPAVAAAITAGNTLEAVLGAWLLRRFDAAREPAATRDAIVIIAVAVAAPLPSATGGVLSLSLAGLVDWSGFAQAWLVWWVGDALGALVVMPVILSWLGPPLGSTPVRRGELVACVAAVVIASAVVFRGDVVWAGVGFGPIVFTPFLLPPLVWAALRLRPRDVSLALVVMSALAVWATSAGHGPFSLHTPIANLVRLQLMLASIAVTLLILVAAVAELKVARRHAEEASRAKSRFVAAVRHDLSQPLQAAQLFLATLSGRRLDAQSRAIVGHLAGALEAIDGALNALKDITAVECDVVRPEVTVFPVNGLLGQLAEEYRAQARRKGLDFQYVPVSAWVRTDRQLLGRVLRNLLANAVRYTSHGRILLGCRRDPRGLRIEVWDTGPGIPPDQQGKIFEAFHRAGVRSVATANGGQGLGLATVRQLTALLGLTVAVRSTVGKGSVFSVVVPTDGGADDGEGHGMA